MLLSYHGAHTKLMSENIDFTTFEQDITSLAARESKQNYMVIGDMQIVWGSNQLASTSPGTTVNFIRPFSGSPRMAGILNDVNPWDTNITTVSPGSFVGRQAYTGSNLWFNWIAIGKAS